MKDLMFVLSACVLAIVVWFVTWDIAWKQAYRAGHRDGWNQFADKLQEERHERGKPKPGTTIRVMLPNGDSYEKRAPLEPPRQ